EFHGDSRTATKSETTDEHTVQPSRNQKASPQRRGLRGGRPWERTLPACPGCPTPLHAGCVRSQETAEENPWQLAKDLRLSSTDKHGSVFICVYLWSLC